MNSDNNLEQLNPEELAALLKKPEGANGIKVAEMLNGTNIHITSFTYDSMNLKDGENILEIGFGNGKLMPKLLDKAKSLKLFGVDFSRNMVEQGKAILKEYINNGHINLLAASVEKLPYEDDYFDAVCTINTLYFWPDAVACCMEVQRVLKPAGKVYIGIRPKEDAQKIPETQYGFTLYNKTEALKLLKKAGFKEVLIKMQTDPPIDLSGETKIFNSLVVIGTK